MSSYLSASDKKQGWTVTRSCIFVIRFIPFPFERVKGGRPILWKNTKAFTKKGKIVMIIGDIICVRGGASLYMQAVKTIEEVPYE